MTTRSVLLTTTLVAVAVLLTVPASPAGADGVSMTTVLKSASKPTYLATGTWRGWGYDVPSWVDTAATGELVTYPAPGETTAFIVGSTCLPRDQDPASGGLVRYQAVGDGSTCMRFTAELRPGGGFAFRVAEPGMPADGRYLGDGDHGGFLDLISTTPTTQYVITEHPALTVTGTVTAAELAFATTGPVQFVFDVTNSGNVTVNSLGLAVTSFTGSDAPSSLVCDQLMLAPGATTECTSDYTVTETDEAQGQIALTVAATALTPSGATVTSAATTATLVTREVVVPQLAATGTPSQGLIAFGAALLTFGLSVLIVGRVRRSRHVHP